MHKFPIIKIIDDVLPAIENHEELIVAEREFFDIICYHINSKDTFSTKHAGWEIRRECRGLIFDKSGKLISRPFHKFFNIGEKEETQEHLLDFSTPHSVLEKEDGSMIRPILLNGTVRLATKMGFSEVAAQAEKWLKNHNRYDDMEHWLKLCMRLEITPIFEWVSPDNRIILEYEKSDLVLLALRENDTGKYLRDYGGTLPGKVFSKVRDHGTVSEDIESFIKIHSSMRDREGDVIFWHNTGQMVKLKNDWYVQLHRTVDELRQWRHVTAKYYANELDDIYPKITEKVRTEIEAFICYLDGHTKAKVINLEGLFKRIVDIYGTDRKRLALWWMASLGPEGEWQAPFIFSMLDGKEPSELVKNYIIKNSTSLTKFNKCLDWLLMGRYKQ